MSKRLSTSMSQEEADVLVVIFSSLEKGEIPPAAVISSIGFAGLCRIVQSLKRRMEQRRT